MMSRKEYYMITKFLNLDPPVLLCCDTEDAFDYIFVCYVRLHKLGIVHQHRAEFMPFNFDMFKSNG